MPSINLTKENSGKKTTGPSSRGACIKKIASRRILAEILADNTAADGDNNSPLIHGDNVTADTTQVVLPTDPPSDLVTPRVPPIINDNSPISDADRRAIEYYKGEIIKLEMKASYLENEFLKMKEKYEKEKQKNNEKCGLVRDLRAQIRKLTTKRASEDVKHAVVLKVLHKVFTKSQVQILLKNKTRAKNWDNETIKLAFTLRYLGRRTYVYLRNKLNYPLPSLPSLRRWASSFDVFSGEFSQVFDVMEIMGTNKNPASRATVLTFDEYSTHKCREYNQANDSIIGPHGHMQVVFARGLYDNFKQPIYAKCDQKMTSEILCGLIKRLHDIGYRVVACSSDLGGGNQGLRTELGVDINKPWFEHPSDPTKKVYMFADAPHVLKLIRNWLIDYGFNFEDGSKISIEPLKEILAQDKGEFKMLHKLILDNIDAEGAERQNVPLAARFLSNAVAAALREFFKDKANNKEALKLSWFVDNINCWFDIMNSYTAGSPDYPYSCAYGRSLQLQDDKLNEVYNMISGMRANSKNNLQVFQSSMLASINALKLLRADMERDFNMSYILTHRLNQDCLENFFSQIRSRGGLYDHPTPLNAFYRIRMIILGKIAMCQDHVNTTDKDNSDDYYVSSLLLKKTKVNIRDDDLKKDDPSADGVSCLLNEGSEETIVLSAAQCKRNLRIHFTEMELCGVRFVAGWVAHKHKIEHPEFGSRAFDYTKTKKSQPTWIEQLSKGGLTEPAEFWLNIVKDIESHFQNYHGKVGLKSGPGVINNLLTILVSLYPDVPKKILKTYARVRTFIRMKYLNCKDTAATKKSKAKKGKKNNSNNKDKNQPVSRKRKCNPLKTDENRKRVKKMNKYMK